MEHLNNIATFIFNSLVHIWPYLLITIPLAVVVQLTGAAKYIKRVLSMNPIWAIILATFIGAFSPFCSCGVIPVIATLLIAGVPLAPVMSFWIASPSMDPEIIFLSAATIGWKLTWWRLAATLIVSLSAGFITHLVMKKNLIGDDILRTKKINPVKSFKQIIVSFVKNSSSFFIARNIKLNAVRVGERAIETEICCTNNIESTGCAMDNNLEVTNSCNDSCCSTNKEKTFFQKLFNETYIATLMVLKFMLLAFFLNALIVLYVPTDLITSILGGNNVFTVFLSTIVGVPFYTSNLTALPLISGLLAQGMNPAAALSFLIAGPTTTLPAMTAVWGITNKRVFILYLSFTFIGALLFGYLGLLFL